MWAPRSETPSFSLYQRFLCILPPGFTSTSWGFTVVLISFTAMQGLHPPPKQRTTYSVEELRRNDDLSSAECQARARAVAVNFGWPSVERLEAEFNVSLAPYYRSYMNYSTYLDVGVILQDITRNGLKRSTGYPIQMGNEVLSPLDVFALPFRHLTRSASVLELSIDYGMSYAPSSLIA